MGLEQSKESGGRESATDCMTCATSAGDDLTGCFVSRRSVHARHETTARETLHTPRYHGTQGVVTVSPPMQAEHRSYIPEYSMEGEAPLAASNNWNSVNGPPSARDLNGSQYARPRVPSATFVGQHNEAKLVFPPQQYSEMAPGEAASMITPRRLVSATNTPRSHADNYAAHTPVITPRAHYQAAGNVVEQYSQLGARQKPAGGPVPAGPSDAVDGHAGTVGGEGSSLGTTGSSSQMTTLADGPSVAASNSTPGSMFLNLAGITNPGVQTPLSPDQPLSSRRSESPRQYVATKGGWIQTSVTISDMNIANWSQQKQDMFIEAVSATAQVPLSDVCVLSLKEKCGRRLLSIATEITFQVKAQSRDHATDIVRELKSQTLDAMMLQANIRIRPDTARTVEDSALLNPRAETNSGPFNTPFRNGYSLSSSYKSQFGGDTIESIAERTSPVPPQTVPPDVAAVAEAIATTSRTPSAILTPREPSMASVAAAPPSATERKPQGTMLL